MREDCKFFQRRVTGAGDPVSFCALDLAPEAPWRCPDECRRYEKVIGERVLGAAELVGEAAHPDEAMLSPGAAGVLGSAAEIIGRLSPELQAEEQRQEKARREAEEKWWNRLRRSPRWRR